jgi:hypothetical protein
MAKLLLMSVIFATLGIPIITARSPSPRHGLKRAILLMLAFNLFYAFALIKIWPRLVAG